MSALRFILAVFLFLTLIIKTNAQDKSFNGTIAAGANMSVISLSNACHLDNNYYPNIGFQVAVGYPIQLKSLELLSEISYVKLRVTDKDEFFFTNSINRVVGTIDGDIIELKSRIESSNLVGISSILRMRKNNWKIGIGIHALYVLSSKSKYKTNLSDKDAKEYVDDFPNNNNYLKKFQLNIPIEVAYSFSKVELYGRYERGLINRLHSKDGIKEFSNNFMLGVRFRFGHN